VRDGEWRRPGAAAAGAEAGAEAGGEEQQQQQQEEEEDERVEGTAEYLAPELCGGGGAPSVASDAYAFGLTLYQMLSQGQLPSVHLHDLWPPSGGGGGGGGGGVRFAVPGVGGEGGGGGGAGASALGPGFPAPAAHLIRALLHPDPAQRLGGGGRGMAEVLLHPWFAPLALGRGRGPSCGGAATSADHAVVADAMQLWARQGPALAAAAGGSGGASGEGGGKWSRRHASSIWAPLQAPSAPRLLSVAGAGAVALEGSSSGADEGRQLPTLHELMYAAELGPL
jgi:hypothetical protein